MAIAGLRNLCTPSYVYLVLSIILLFVMALQNLSNPNVYCLGLYQCDVYSTPLIFAIKIVYVLFWTWILNLICRAGAPGLAWFLVLLPFILLFVLLGLLFLKPF
jgi:hypothetical protein